MRLIYLAIALSVSLPSIAADKINQGQASFAKNCEQCHQEDAVGKPGLAPSLVAPEFLSIASDQFLFSTIKEGRPNTPMNSMAHLGDENIKAIIAYLRSKATLPDRSKEIAAQPNAHGDPRLGKQWFDNICSTCHGVKGDGYEAGGTGTAIGKVGFLNKVSDGFIRTTIKEGRSNTRMLSFTGPSALANLSSQEIDDIIVYLRKLRDK